MTAVGSALAASKGRTASNPLAVLDGAAGLVTFWNSSFGVTQSGGRVSAWVDRKNSLTLTQPDFAFQPDWAGTAPKGQTGVRGVIARTAGMSCIGSSLFDVFDNADAYSFLMVRARTTTAANRPDWDFQPGLGGFFVQRLSSTNVISYRRQETGGLNTTNSAAVAEPTAAAVVTGVFTGTTISQWTNGTVRINAGANTRNIGAYSGGGVTLFLDGLGGIGDSTLWCLMIAAGQWTTVQRQSYEAAATSIWL